MRIDCEPIHSEQQQQLGRAVSDRLPRIHTRRVALEETTLTHCFGHSETFGAGASQPDKFMQYHDVMYYLIADSRLNLPIDFGKPEREVWADLVVAGKEVG